MSEVIVITGAGSGIGGACGALAAAKGLSVVNLDRNAPGEGAPKQTYLQIDLADVDAGGSGRRPLHQILKGSSRIGDGGTILSGWSLVLADVQAKSNNNATICTSLRK